MSIVDRTNAEHYRWGEVCDGWRYLDRPDISVIRERVPPGGAEVRHHHVNARQFFYVLSGRAALEVDGQTRHLCEGQGTEVPPGARHQFRNESEEDVEFLVISSPTTRGDRVEVDRTT